MNKRLPTITWVADNDLSESLHAATWLETTKILREIGWKVNLLSYGKIEEEKDVRGVLVRFFSKPNIFFIQQFLYHVKIFHWMIRNDDQHQIVIFHGISGLWLLLFKWYVRVFSKKEFTFVMDTRTLPMEPIETLTARAKLRRAYLHWMDYSVGNWFDGRMAITLAMAEALKIPSKTLWAVWPSGVKPEIFSACTEQRQYPKDDELIRLIYIGCMHVERNLMTMSKAVVRVNQHVRRFQLVLVGDGNQFDELQNYSKQHDEDVLIHGPVSQSEIPDWLAGSHVGLLPFPDEQKFRVSSPIKLFEYMAAGMPIAATKIRCHTDVFAENAPFVFWANGSDQEAFVSMLEEIGTRKHELQQLGQQSAKKVNHWTWQASARKIDDGLRSHLNLGVENHQ